MINVNFFYFFVAQPMDIDGPTTPAPSTKTLKRKPDAPHAVSRTGSNSEEMDLDDIDADEVPRPKKSKPSLPSKPTVAGKGRQASTTASASRSASSTALNSPVTSSHMLPSVTDQPSKGQKKGAASQKAAVVAAQKAVLEKENEALKGNFHHSSPLYWEDLLTVVFLFQRNSLPGMPKFFGFNT